MNYNKIGKPSVVTLYPYQPGKPFSELERELGIRDIIPLASNENPLGPSPKAIAAAQQACTQANFYPDSSGYALKHKLAERLSIEPSQIALGNGSDDILHIIGQAFLEPSDEVLIPEYAFVSYQLIAFNQGAHPVVEPAKEWEHDLEGMVNAISKDTKIIYLANPNNPTGTWFTEAQLKRFLEKVPENVLVVIDEAYYEYMQHEPEYPDSLMLQKRFENLIITRPFSKAYGLAGLRIGYGIAHPDVIGILDRARMPFNVSNVALRAAEAALDHQRHLEESILLNQKGLAYLYKSFAELNLDVISNAGNFATVSFKQDGNILYNELLKRGIIVRPLGNYHMPHQLRISVGLPEQNHRLIRVLSRLVNQDEG